MQAVSYTHLDVYKRQALDDESVIERLAHTTSVDEVLELLAGRKSSIPTLSA